ncbi:MAG: thioredoxin [Clostridiales bacterium]|jgi:hypothetical protein|nr:thioredoxin [Clostridiales bacterium]
MKKFQLTLLVSGIIMTAVGIANGEASEILAKATVVCMECIGIG